MAAARNGLASGGQFIAQWRDAILDDKTLTAGEKLTAMAVARFADSKSLSTFTAASTLGELASSSERTIRPHITSLIAKGYLRSAKKKITRAWAARELFLLKPRRGAEEIAAAHSHGVEESAAARTDGPEKNGARSGKNRPEVRQNLPTIPRIYPEEYISSEAARAGRPAGPAPPLAESVCNEIRQLSEQGLSAAQIARRLRDAGNSVNTKQVTRVIAPDAALRGAP